MNTESLHIIQLIITGIERMVNMISVEGLTLQFILLCIFLGFLGQLFHLGIGLYKRSMNKKKRNEKFNINRCLIGLFLGAFIGGLLSLIYTSPLRGQDLIAILAAGYMGVDFIEAFFQRRSEMI